MKIEICEKQKIVYYWMTQEERDSNQEMLTAEHKEWKKKKFRVCTFISGQGNLTELTKELIVHNQKVLAEQEYNENQTTAQEECAA